MTACKICAIKLDPRTQVRWTIAGATFCSLNCVWVYRGREKCV